MNYENFSYPPLLLPHHPLTVLLYDGHDRSVEKLDILRADTYFSYYLKYITICWRTRHSGGHVKIKIKYYKYIYKYGGVVRT